MGKWNERNKPNIINTNIKWEWINGSTKMNKLAG